MSVEIEISYEGNLFCEAVHGPSQSRLRTEAPTDNGGRGEKFSPTDLVATALGTCILTIAGLVAKRHEWDLRGARVRVVKEMAADPVRRIGSLRAKVTLPNTRRWSPEDRRRLENAARGCPVTASLHPAVKVGIEFVYPD